MLLKPVFTHRYCSYERNIVLPCKTRLPTGNKRHLASLSLPRATATCPVSRTRKPSSYSRYFQWWMLSLSGKFSEPGANPPADTESSESELAPDALENTWISFCTGVWGGQNASFVSKGTVTHLRAQIFCSRKPCTQQQCHVPAYSALYTCVQQEMYFYSRWTATTAFGQEHAIEVAANSNLSRSSQQHLPTSLKAPYKGQLDIRLLLQCFFSINQEQVY